MARVECSHGWEVSLAVLIHLVCCNYASVNFNHMSAWSNPLIKEPSTLGLSTALHVSLADAVHLSSLSHGMLSLPTKACIKPQAPRMPHAAFK